MSFVLRTVSRLLLPCVAIGLAVPPSLAAKPDGSLKVEAVAAADRGVVNDRLTLAELKAAGRQRSLFKELPPGIPRLQGDVAAADAFQPNLARFETTIKPILEQNCSDCHGPDAAEGNVRIDALDPNLLSGADVEGWLKVLAVIAKGEMPPADYGRLADDSRQQIIDWLAAELHVASIVRRRSETNSGYRRMTRYEYNYALQDLLGVPWDFAKDLPPEAHSEQGFENSADLLHLSVSQLETYHRIARNALLRATATGDKPPTRYWNVSMKDAAARQWAKQDDQVNQLKEELQDDPDELAAALRRLERSFRKRPPGAYYIELPTGRAADAEWEYYNAKYAFAPTDSPVVFPEDNNCVAILPEGSGSRLIVELGNQLPDEGVVRVTVRAARVNNNNNSFPSLQLLFGWQASNEGRALLRVSDEDVPVTASPDQPQIIQWDVELSEIYPRNAVRKTSPMGALPSPSEYIRLVNASASRADAQIDFVQVAAPVYDQWPPASHRRIFGAGDDSAADEASRARKVITTFMARAWRRPIDDQEIDRKMDLFEALRPQCHGFEEAVVEVLATVLSSPQFLYVSDTAGAESQNQSAVRPALDGHALATRLSFFVWCSIPDDELLTLAGNGRLAEPGVLATELQRMLDDPRSERFATHFVRQWLDMELLEFQDFQRHIPGFDPLLKEAMQREPVALFDEMLQKDASLLDFVHCDYAMVNERLARHYGLSGVYGNHFRRVPLNEGFRRGGLLTQAGPLAMNSDWPDSHPIKRAIWLLECVLDDPPPPPPPAVPQIDLADPEIAKMTLKERIEDHRNHAACMACHVKIDPWGIAFENYDALGQWRYRVNGKRIDPSSELYHRETLDGMRGLKRFLLQNRQDQIVRSIVSKLATYALGRRLVFADRAEIDAITARVRRDGDGLRTAVEAIVQSELFRTM